MSWPDDTREWRAGTLWSTTLVDLAALILTLFVLLFATTSQRHSPTGTVERAAAPPAGIVPNEITPPASWATALLSAVLREQLRQHRLQPLVTAAANDSAIVLTLADPFALRLANGDPPGDRKTAVLLDLLLRVAPSLTELTVVWPATGSETFPMALERAESLKQRLRATGLRLPLRSEIAPQPGWRPQLRLALGRS